jgi:hypothetical protein
MWSRAQRPDADLEGAADWKTEVEHIQTGRRWIFSDVDELLDFLQQQSAASGHAQDGEELREQGDEA